MSSKWPSDELDEKLRMLNRNFMAASPLEFLRGRDSWPNRLPELLADEVAEATRAGAAAISVEELIFREIMESGNRFNWAVLLDGSLRVSHSTVRTADGLIRISHAILSPGGGDVLAAGEGRAGKFLSNTSGHYKNEAFVLPPIRDAFAIMGIAFER